METFVFPGHGARSSPFNLMSGPNEKNLAKKLKNWRESGWFVVPAGVVDFCCCRCGGNAVFEKLEGLAELRGIILNARDIEVREGLNFK